MIVKFFFQSYDVKVNLKQHGEISGGNRSSSGTNDDVDLSFVFMKYQGAFSY